MIPATSINTRAADSTDRIPALSTAKPAAGQPANAPAPVGVVRRLLSTLMRALANPHV